MLERKSVIVNGERCDVIVFTSHDHTSVLFNSQWFRIAAHPAELTEIFVEDACTCMSPYACPIHELIHPDDMRDEGEHQ